jgi:hypothetical protein
MHEIAQVKAAIPRDLKKRTFAALALREEKFNRWLRTQMEEWLRQVEADSEEDRDARLVGSATRG